MNLPLKNQVCSLELSQKLKELGVPQESLFYWRDDGFELLRKDEMREDWYDTFPSAYTVAELLPLLPKEVNIAYKNGKPRDRDHYFGMWRVPVGS